jgi:alpha-tubulin suppressor-like RCC1 family protein
VYGYLARGTLGVDVNDPLQAEVYDFGTTRRVIQIATNRYHVCVLFEDGRARCWGNNEQGQLGDGTQQNFGDDSTEILSERPDLSLTHIKSITAGRDGTCAISDVSGSDKVYCWGANARGEVGIASGADRVLNPSGQPITLNTVPKAVIGNQYSYCALLATNVARCWGTYLKGVRGMGVTNYDLGDNETPSSNAFNVQGVPNPISQLAGSYFTNCAISSGDLYCWGGNLNSEAGYPNASYGDEIWQTPGKVNLGDVSLVQASVTDQYGCGVDDEGVVRCWGSNLDDGALGYPYVYRVGYAREPAADYQLMHDALLDGGSPDSGVTPGLPIGAVDLGDFDETPGLDRAVRVEAGYHRTCALMEGGTLRCWGQNSYGTIGYAEAGEFIGLTDSPAQAYRQIGYSDVKVFGPPSDP